jgi:hypothetical protein
MKQEFYIQAIGPQTKYGEDMCLKAKVDGRILDGAIMIGGKDVPELYIQHIHSKVEGEPRPQAFNLKFGKLVCRLDIDSD